MRQSLNVALVVLKITVYIAETSLELNSPASTFQVLKFEVCATRPIPKPPFLNTSH